MAEVFVAVAIPLCEVLPASPKRQGGKLTPLLVVNAIFAMMADSKSRNATKQCCCLSSVFFVGAGQCWWVLVVWRWSVQLTDRL
jgi:hypothetical protein